MSKEEAERSNAQVRSSSTPPRERASEPPRALPSTPPETDDIDTDWGVEQSPAPTAHVAAPLTSAPSSTTMTAGATPDRISTLPASVASEALPASKRAAAPPPAAPPLVPGVRPNRLRSQTLLGMPEPKLSTTPETAPPPPDAPAAATPEHASASSTPLSTAPNEAKPRQTPLLARTLIGMAEPVPAAPTPQSGAHAAPPVAGSGAALSASEPRAALPTPVPDAQATSEHARSSVPPPLAPPAPASTPPVSAQQAERPRRAPMQPTATASTAKGSGRAIAWLAAAGLALGVLGYFAAHRSSSRAVSAEVQAAIPAAASPPAAAAPTPELAAPSEAESAAPSTASAAPSAASAAPSTASAAPSVASGSVPAAGNITVTVKSVPPKARVFHFGKQVGITPWVVELKPGERHAYEVGFPGRVTRKLVLDGSKTEITVGLKPAP